MTHGAELRFRQRAGLNPPVNPAQVSEPGIITMPDGSERKITLEIKVNGAWKKVDPKSIPYQKEIAKRCHMIYQTAMQTTDLPETLTVYFEQHISKSGTFFKEEVVDLTFNKIEYKTADSDTLQVFDVKTHEFADEADAIQVNQLASSMAQVSKAIFSKPENFLEQPTKIKTKSAAERNSEKLAAVKRTLNVQEAGSQNNRCLTLSLAAIVLKKLDGNLEKAASLFNVIFVEGEEPLITISNKLIEIAAQTIETADFYNRDDCFDSVIAALRSAGQTIADETNREAVARQYAALIRQPGQMLDVPVLKAIEKQGLPIITLVPSQGDLVLGSVSSKIHFNESLDTCDLTNICFLVRDGLHYQPVINDTSNVAQQEKLRSILKNDMEKTLDQIQNLIASTQGTLLEKSVEFNKLVTSVVFQYPSDAKPRIAQMLRSAGRTIEDDTVTNGLFVSRAYGAFLNNPIPVIEDLL